MGRVMGSGVFGLPFSAMCLLPSRRLLASGCLVPTGGIRWGTARVSASRDLSAFLTGVERFFAIFWGSADESLDSG